MAKILKNLVTFVICFIPCVIVGIFSQSCPEKNGRFANPGQCDSYIECNDGIPEEKLCPDGLLFNDKAKWFSYPCGYPVDVDCGSRGKIQQALATEECPHQFGYYKVGDKSNCGQFMNCVNGKSFIFECPEGLAWSSETYRCDWPDLVSDCDAEAYLGFKCPPNPNAAFLQEHRFFEHPIDCQRYFVCVGDQPRLNNCGEGYAFDIAVKSCDGRENVTTCR